MREKRYVKEEELPLFLSALDLCRIFGISRSHAYHLLHLKGFPALTVGSRLMVRREELFKWLTDGAGGI